LSNDRNRFWKIVAWSALTFVAYATLSPIGDRPVVLASPQVEHFAAFALLGVAFMLAYPNSPGVVIFIVIGSAFLFEALQLITPDRHARVWDAVAKAAGGACGIGAGCINAR
jgi:VanZ family protein